MTVSVLMSMYREKPEYAISAIESVIGQSYSDFELLLALDDPSNCELRDLGLRYSKRDSRVRFIENETNRGLAATLNALIDLSHGEYVCRMDSDDWAYPQRIAVQKRMIDEEGFDLVGGTMRVVSDDGSYLYLAKVPTSSRAVARSLVWNNCVPHPTWFGRKEVFCQGYREIPLCEDYDFLLRASSEGAKIGNSGKVVLDYRMTTNSLSRSRLYQQYLYQRYLTKNYKNGRIVDVREAADWVAGQWDEDRAKRYDKANRIFNAFLESMSAGEHCSALTHALALPFASYAYLDKIKRLGIASLMARIS